MRRNGSVHSTAAAASRAPPARARGSRQPSPPRVNHSAARSSAKFAATESPASAPRGMGGAPPGMSDTAAKTSAANGG